MKLKNTPSFSTAELPLPEDHWLYKEEENIPPQSLKCMVTPHNYKDLKAKICKVMQYALRTATMNGTATLDPDALVQNAVIGLIGYDEDIIARISESRRARMNAQT